MLFSLLTISVFGQTTFSKEYYLQKSKNQKKTGWILLGGGTLMAVIGAVSFNSNYNSSGDYGSTDAAGFLFLGGVAADLISIPVHPVMRERPQHLPSKINPLKNP